MVYPTIEFQHVSTKVLQDFAGPSYFQSPLLNSRGSGLVQIAGGSTTWDPTPGVVQRSPSDVWGPSTWDGPHWPHEQVAERSGDFRWQGQKALGVASTWKIRTDCGCAWGLKKTLNDIGRYCPSTESLANGSSTGITQLRWTGFPIEAWDIAVVTFLYLNVYILYSIYCISISQVVFLSTSLLSNVHV